MPFIVEQVGYDPTPSDFQSAAMTTSATAPLFLICGGEETRTLKIPQCKCGAVTNFATPPIKNSHILLNCVSLIALYFYLVIFDNSPDN